MRGTAPLWRLPRAPRLRCGGPGLRRYAPRRQSPAECWRSRDSTSYRPVHQEERRHERRRTRRWSAGPPRSRGCRRRARRLSRTPPSNSMTAAAARRHASHGMFVRYSCCDASPNFSASRPSAPKALTMRWPGTTRRPRATGAPAPPGCVASSRGAAGRASRAVDDDRRAGQAHQRELGVVVESRPAKRRPSALLQEVATVSATTCCT